MSALLLAAVLSASQPPQGYVYRLLEPATHPASLRECERAGARDVVATVNVQRSGERFYFRRTCVSLRQVRA